MGLRPSARHDQLYQRSQRFSDHRGGRTEGVSIVVVFSLVFQRWHDEVDCPDVFTAFAVH